MLRALWAHKEANVTELHNLIDRPDYGISKVRASLEKLHFKRLVRRRKVSQAYYYRAALEPATFTQLMHRELHDILGVEGMKQLCRVAPCE